MQIQKNINNNDLCCGCTACSTVCKKGAISVQLNEFGFYKATVDKDKCIDCGLCVQMCPVLNLGQKRKPEKQYVCWNTVEEERTKSTSGGLFIGIASEFMNNSGIVVGAVYNDDFMGVHHATTEIVPLRKLQKSKYVVSDLRNVFVEILEHIAGGKRVLFVGTPCQVAGLKKVVKDDTNLYTIDFICGGTPSEKCFSDHMKKLSLKYKANISNVDFRSKDSGWSKMYMDVKFVNGKKYHKSYFYDPYYAMFSLEHLTTMYVCNNCPFRQRHEADLTIADFWGYRDVGLNNDDKGISIAAVNNKKGEYLYSLLVNKESSELSYDSVSYAYEEYNTTEEKIEKKQRFFNELRGDTFSNIYSKYVKTDFMSVLLRRIKSRLG